MWAVRLYCVQKSFCVELSAVMITTQKSDPTSAESQRLMTQLSVVLAAITGDEGKGHFSSDTLNAPRALWALARDHHGVAIGCGAIRPLSATTAEVKRVFSTGEIAGTGAALMRFLEQNALLLGYRDIWLATRQINSGAVAFYRRQGYEIIDNYGDYVGREETICLAKRLYPR